MKRLIPCFLSLIFLASPAAQAVEINLIKVGSPEANQLADIYGDAYGYSPQEVAPSLLGPMEEAPSLLRIAQAGGVSPLSTFMMRRMGMSYGTILKNLALTPTVLAGASGLPSVSRWTDAGLIDLGRNYFLSDVLQVTPRLLPYFPKTGWDFANAVLHPYHPTYGSYLPPGIAKKYGFWAPPGQMKKMDGIDRDWGYSNHDRGHGNGQGHGKKSQGWFGNPSRGNFKGGQGNFLGSGSHHGGHGGGKRK